MSAAALLLVAITSNQQRKEAIDQRHETATKEYVDQMEKRISECEKGRHELRTENISLNDRYDKLRDENHDLRIRILEVERKQI